MVVRILVVSYLVNDVSLSSCDRNEPMLFSVGRIAIQRFDHLQFTKMKYDMVKLIAINDCKVMGNRQIQTFRCQKLINYPRHVDTARACASSYTLEYMHVRVASCASTVKRVFLTLTKKEARPPRLGTPPCYTRPLMEGRPQPFPSAISHTPIHARPLASKHRCIHIILYHSLTCTQTCVLVSVSSHA